MMCRLCQFVFNLALAGDHLLNTLLLGDPNETLSRRVARARDSGHRWASVACRALAAVFGTGHCDKAEQAGSRGRELWPWSPDEAA